MNFFLNVIPSWLNNFKLVFLHSECDNCIRLNANHARLHKRSHNYLILKLISYKKSEKTNDLSSTHIHSKYEMRVRSERERERVHSQ